ncbi:alpha/beta hydrolase family protein [Nocardia nova SH22a]|uniref:Alpha/beta hydrolase family protein n=1 Tax=Nocardia nova SH22a TaxID=1415166 RepID=W5TR32_9NOCA|nr:alpha/beta hydrolase [Nocardia nova]AHH21835.1 alpha/beta hydrolase family protein [Nocardia nova SH22a]
MLGNLPENLADLRTGPGALTAGFRAKLRSRRYRTAELNAAPDPEVSTVTTADGAKLRVHSYGPADGDVIVFVHGWSCCLEYWNPQINAFASDHRVIAFDLRGHGASTLGSRRFEAEQLADDLSDVLDAVLPAGRRAVLVGHSMGGITIQSWAKFHPEQVARRASAAMLLTTTAGDIAAETRVLPLFNDIVPAPTWLGRALFGQPVPFPPGSPAREIIKARIMNRHATADQVDFALSIVRSCRPLVRARFALALIELEIHGAAASLAVPTVVIAGAYDNLLPESMSRKIADELAAAGNLEHYSVQATGHLANIEASAEFNAELRRLVDVARHGRRAAAG